MPLSGNQKKQYQKDYMARRRGAHGAVFITNDPADAEDEDLDQAGPPPVEHDADPVPLAPRGKLNNPYRDGLPDWPEIIQSLTQKQRDALLEAMPHTKSKF